MSNREALRAMKRLGISLNEVPDVQRVTIEAKDVVIEITNPKVLEIGGKIGEAGFQVLGGEVSRKSKVQQAEAPEVSEEDVEFVAAQAGVDKERAREALIKANGDIAQALMLLKRG